MAPLARIHVTDRSLDVYLASSPGWVFVDCSNIFAVTLRAAYCPPSRKRPSTIMNRAVRDGAGEREPIPAQIAVGLRCRRLICGEFGRLHFGDIGLGFLRCCST